MAKTQVVHELSVKNITADNETQPRGTIDVDVVREYSDAMLEGDQFPPCSVFFDGVKYWLADGFHRYMATIKAGLPSLRCVVFQGDKDDAILFSVGANALHGIRRTNADKRRVVLKMLNHPEWCKWSDAEIARRCHVSASTVSRYRENSPGVTGHNVTLRLDRNGHLHDESTGPPAPPRFAMPPTPLSKSDLGEQYSRKVVRHLKQADPDVRANVVTPFGVADAVDKSRAYILATAADRHVMFAVIGRALMVASHLGRSPAVIGHFPRSVTTIVDAAIAYGFMICSPESLIAEVKVKA